MMKKLILSALACIFTAASFAQPATHANSLLWRISGNGLTQPSYLFGTIHMICDPDIKVSDSLRYAIKNADHVYLELDMDNMKEIMSVIHKMKMNNDTTLADLLTAEEYAKVKSFFQDRPSIVPFSMLEKYKPMLAASSLMEMSMDCDQPVAMEQLIMQEAKTRNKDIRGLETMAFQMSIFDSIPYKTQARQLFHYIDNYGKKTTDHTEFDELARAYRNQDLNKLGSLTSKTKSDLNNFLDVLLYRRNGKWVDIMKEVMPGKTLLVAVGAGHLPGEKGLIELLRKAGYTVEAMQNDMIVKHEKQL